MLHQRCLSLLVGLVIFVTSPTFAADTWQAGAAKIKITPEQPVWMAGYASRTRPADSKLTELWAKALLIEDPRGQRVLLVTLDLVGIDRELALEVRKALAEQHQLTLGQVSLCTSHTHSGPVVAGNLRPMHDLLPEPQQKLIADYARVLVKKIIDCARTARKQLAPCELSFGTGQATFATNRRNNKEAEIVALRAAGQIVGPVDHDVPVLAVRDKSGKLLAVTFGYACHATVLSDYAWCGDYPGYAQLDIEKQHPEAIALFWAGCGGDQNPLPRRKVELAQAYGQQLAQAVNAVLKQPMAPVRGAIQANYQEIDLPLAKLPTVAELQLQTESKDKYVVARAKYLLQQIEAGQPLSPTYPYPITRWQLGDTIEWIFLGGEVVVDYAVRIKSSNRAVQPWVTAYSNDVMAYIPSRRVLGEGGYEGGGSMVYYGLPTLWADAVEEEIIGAGKKLAEAKP
ncbi:MAG TPA: neutral/alkaline non-lysosomal ceramidase N-terminal domain-containing protein [Pirellulaceae bacterium]|nr:neutral/alkaline non-lysosomal ceramidase N-terminal domain-containing protein [Pirellulaceae bacterium]